jgi:two-component system, chemotaxis family, CheB/CheR fusion protein
MTTIARRRMPRPRTELQRGERATRRGSGAFPVVGVAASAGGVAACRRLFGAVPSDSGMAFVIAPHLARRRARLTEVLRQVTSMRVVDIESGVRLEPDRVFVVPPAVDVAIREGVFEVSEHPDARSRRRSIDRLFEALSASHGRRTIGVLLSGAGSSGIDGLRAIRVRGGITFAQDPATARVPQLPASAVAAGVVDHCLPPEAIAAALARPGRSPSVIGGIDAPARRRARGGLDVALPAITRRVLDATGIDLTDYRPATVARRVAKRMSVRRIARADAYVAVLERDPVEVDALVDAVLRHGARWFRDAEVLEAIEHRVFPAIVANKAAGAPIRVWVAGCATGEDVYSIAISLLEFLSAHGRRHPVQIFGSDVNARAIARARAGGFTEAALRDVRVAWRERFFTPVDGGARVVEAIRRLCVFTSHDVARDPPFASIDLVMCRTALGHLGAHHRWQALTCLRHALAAPGFVVLGRSEPVAAVEALFAPFDGDHRIFVGRPMSSGRDVLDRVDEAPAAAEAAPRRADDAPAAVDHQLRRRNDELVKLNDDLVELIGAIDTPIVSLSGDRRIRYATPSARRLLNLDPADVGRSLDEVDSALGTADIERRIGDALTGATVVEADVKARDGRWYRLQIRPCAGSSDRSDGVVVALVDVDAVKHAVVDAERACAYAAAIVEALPVPLLVVTESLRVVAASRAFHRVFDLTAGDTLGRHLGELAHGAWNVPELLVRLREVGAGRRVDAFTVERDFPALGRRVLEVSGDPIGWDRGERCVLVAVHDVTTRALAEREGASALERAEHARDVERHARDEAEHASRTKDVFLATLSHELRTPLTSILLNTGRLRELEMPTIDDIRHIAAGIDRAARAQAQLIEDLLDVSRVIAGKLRLSLEPVDLSALVASAIDTMQPGAGRDDLRVEVAIAPSVGVVLGDAGRLQQVVWNLVTNAVKFTPAGGAIRIELFARGPVAVLRIRDTGRGIDRRHLDTVFGLFSQEDDATAPRGAGLGLGLAIVRHLVEAHRGRVRADSRGIGQGATFTVELPLAAIEAAAAERVDGVARDDLSGVDVLVVDDDALTREVVANLLADKGASVRAAASALDGLAAVRARAPDVVLCDLAMPDHDGYEFLAAVRALPAARLARLPVVAMTARATEVDRARALAAGFDDHVAKPVESRLLAAIVGRFRGA